MSKINCAAIGCTQQIDKKAFMCRPHWESLPHALRNSIWKLQTFFPKSEKQVRTKQKKQEDGAFLESQKEYAISYVRNLEKFRPVKPINVKEKS